MNFRISQGQAIRSVFGCSLVTHFMCAPPFLAVRSLTTPEHDGPSPRRLRPGLHVHSGRGLVIPYGIIPSRMSGEQGVIRSIERANQRVRRYLAKHLEQLGVTEIEAHLLARLAAKGPCSVADLQ